jgi:hypothetical protein
VLTDNTLVLKKITDRFLMFKLIKNQISINFRIVFKVLAVCSAFISFHFAFSQEKIVSEFAFVMSNQDINELPSSAYANWQGSLTRNLGNKQIQSPYKTEISNLDLHLDYEVQTQTPLKRDGVYPFFSYLKNTHLNIKSITTRDKIQQRKGNLTVNVEIKGQCRNITAKFNQPYLPVKGFVELRTENGRATLKLTQFDFSYNSALWKLDFNTCVGPQGYGEVLKSNILKYLEDKNQIATLIKSGIEEQLSQASTTINNKIFKVQKYKLNESISLDIYPSRLNYNSKGEMVLMGSLMIYFMNAKTSGQTFVKLNDYNIETSGSSNLILPSELVQKVISAAYRNGLIAGTVRPLEVDGLQDLLRSRFQQFFVWPDLMNFSKNTNFIFDIFSKSTPIIKNLSSEDGTLLGEANSEMVNQVLYPKEQKHFPYVKFSSNAQSHWSAEILKEDILIRILQISLDSSYEFNKTYLQSHNANEYINLFTLEDQLRDQILKQEFRFSIGGMDLDVLGILYPQGIIYKNNTIEIPYGKKQVQKDKSSLKIKTEQSTWEDPFAEYR